MRHIDRAHLSMMRHLSAQARRKGANSVAEQIGRTGHAPAQRDTALARAQQSFRREQQAAAKSMRHPHHTTVVSSVQRGLSAIGLGGAAHPIRRLHHPGGQAMFPLGGRGIVDAHDKVIMSRVGPAVAAAELLTVGPGIGIGLASLDGLMGHGAPGQPARDRQRSEREYKAMTGPPGGPRGAYLRDVDYLFRTRQITAAQQAQAYGWAWATPPGEIRARRQSLRSGGLQLPPLNR